MIIEILAWSGALLSCLLSLPQLLQAFRSNRLDGVSTATYWLVLGNATVWASWAALAGQYAAGVPSLVNGPAAVLIIIRLHQVRPSEQPAPVRRDELVAHQQAVLGNCPATGRGSGSSLPARVRPLAEILAARLDGHGRPSGHAVRRLWT